MTCPNIRRECTVHSARLRNICGKNQLWSWVRKTSWYNVIFESRALRVCRGNCGFTARYCWWKSIDSFDSFNRYNYVPALRAASFPCSVHSKNTFRIFCYGRGQSAISLPYRITSKYLLLYPPRPPPTPECHGWIPGCVHSALKHGATSVSWLYARRIFSNLFQHFAFS